MRGPEASRYFLPREQPDRAVDAGGGEFGRACVRRQGSRLRHSRHLDRRHGSRSRRRGVHVGCRARQGGPRPDVDRGDRDAHVRPRAPRRHAVSRQGPAAVVGLPPASQRWLREPGALRLLGEARSAATLRRKARGRGCDQPRRARSHEEVGPRAGGAGGEGRHRHAVAEAGDRRSRRLRGGSVAHPHRAAGARASPGALARRRSCTRSIRGSRSTRRGTRFSKP